MSERETKTCPVCGTEQSGYFQPLSCCWFCGAALLLLDESLPELLNSAARTRIREALQQAYSLRCALQALAGVLVDHAGAFGMAFGKNGVTWASGVGGGVYPQGHRRIEDLSNKEVADTLYDMMSYLKEELTRHKD